MQRIKIYLDLIRFSNQTGTVLLFIPCLCGLVYAANFTGKFSAYECLLLYVSAFLARSCGCILNDIADFKIDANIPTTSHRVLASGQLSVKQALRFFALMVLSGLPLLWFYSAHVFLPLAIIGVVTVVYPYSKRFFAIPQVFLGVIYASGFIIAVVHSLAIPFWRIDIRAFFIYLALVLWVIFYDTIYAKRDFEYDITLGVNSSAVFFVKGYKKVFWLSVAIFCGLFLVNNVFFSVICMSMICVAFLANRYSADDSDIRKINNVLILTAGVSNAVLACSKGFGESVPLLFMLGIQCVSVFAKPQYGFKINTLCVVPLLFAM